MLSQSLLQLVVAGLAVAQDGVKLKPAKIDTAITPGKPMPDMPVVGFGTWNIPNNQKGIDAVARAIKMGYRHIDGATAYTNQQTVGKGIKKALAEDPTIKREHLWVTTKIWATQHTDVKGATDLNLQQLGLDYVDCQLVHFPVGNSNKPKLDAAGKPVNGPDGRPVTETVAAYDYVAMWKEMEKSIEPDAKGFRKVRTIGISNFNVTQLEDLLSQAKVKPHNHQIESHPYLQDWKFTDLHVKHNIPIVAYAPLGNTNPEYHYRNWKSAGKLMLADPTLKRIANARGCTPAQVALVWNLNRNVTVIPKAENVVHQVDNYEARSVCKLTNEDMAAIKALDKDGKAGRRYWDMCCAMNLPCFLGLQDANAAAPVMADWCEDPTGARMKYNKERSDLWQTPKEVCQRPL